MSTIIIIIVYYCRNGYLFYRASANNGEYIVKGFVSFSTCIGGNLCGNHGIDGQLATSAKTLDFTPT